MLAVEETPPVVMEEVPMVDEVVTKEVPMVNSINVDELLESTGRSIKVEKEVPLTLDEGSLIAFDMAPVEMGKLGQGKARDAFLKALTRDNTQLLFNSLFSLPSAYVEKAKCVQLPAPTTRVPRSNTKLAFST
jgi:hypothetical protein